MRSIVRVWAWVHPVLIGCAMKNTARLFNCASCHQQVVLCRHCDHGNIYCSRSCSDRVRRRSQRHGVLDRTATGERVGCEELLAATQRTCPRLHVFGHIHQGHGWRRLGRTLHVNASNCAGLHEPLNPVLVVDLPADGDAVIAAQLP